MAQGARSLWAFAQPTMKPIGPVGKPIGHLRTHVHPVLMSVALKQGDVLWQQCNRGIFIQTVL